MANSKEGAVAKARKDLAHRLGVDETEVREESVSDVEFPDMSLGAAEDGEMSGQMITPGWRIRLHARGQNFEYRANKNQIRVYNYKGANQRI